MAETENAPAKDFMVPAPHEENVGVLEGAVVSVIEQAEINQQIATAHRYPRDITTFRRQLYQMVTIDVDTAESCIYAVPRDGKMIDGPSIRFAELILPAWKNNRASTEVTGIDDEFVVASGVFMDLEANSAIQAKVMRRITGKPTREHPKGKRYTQDGIANTGNAACSIALRNAILRGVPKALWKDIWEEAKKVAAGTAQTFKTRRDKVMKELGIQGATPEQIFQLLGIKGLDDMQSEHIVHLRGLQNAIKDGETTLEDAFGPQLKPGQAVPPQPNKNDFTREEPGAQKPDEKKTAEATKEEPKPEPEKEKEPAAAVSADAAFDDWFKDSKKELSEATKVRDIGTLRDAVAEQLDGENLKEWTALCEARIKEILDATRKKR